MAKFGRVENGKVREVVEAADQNEIDTKFHSSIAAQFVLDPSNLIEQGWEYDGANFSAPAPIDNTPTVQQIKDEANKRIAASGHDWQIIRQISDGTPVPQAILDYAAAVRAASTTLEASLPEDYSNDVHWPTVI
jgi:hypothetical protein